jgi:hypothetical protein
MFKRMDTLVACITENDMFLAMPDTNHKNASIKDNQEAYNILIKCPDATREEFESLLKTKNSNNALVEMLYWNMTENM